MLKKIRTKGVTLPEMMTAVGITVIMLAASGMIFKAASHSSGKAIALNDMMSKVRVVTNRMDQDFSGFRGDLPFGIVFEAYNRGDGTFERRDRIFFFSNGDFQSLNSGKRADVARIFYGQTADIFSNSNTDPDLSLTSFTTFEEADKVRNGLEYPFQRILCRKAKLMTTDSSYDSKALDWFHYEMSDMEYCEGGPDTFWKSLGETNSGLVYNYIYMYEAYDTAKSRFFSSEYSAGLPFTNISIIRRPNFQDIKSAINNANATSIAVSMNNMDLYKQKISLFDDVTDFSVQLWWTPPGESSPRWYPNDNDLLSFISDSNNSSLAFNNTTSTIFYNTRTASNSHAYFGLGLNLASLVSSSMYINGFGPQTSWNFGSLNIWPLNPNEKLKAIKISFRLYDPGRNHFPDNQNSSGKYYEYVVRLP